MNLPVTTACLETINKRLGGNGELEEAPKTLIQKLLQDGPEFLSQSLLTELDKSYGADPAVATRIANAPDFR